MELNRECPRCQAGITAYDARCPACGVPRTDGVTPLPIPSQPGTTTASQTSARSLLDNPYAVLAAVFLAMGALGIPLIWMCRAWSIPTKILLIIATVLYTALLAGLCWLAVAHALEVWQNAKFA